YYNLHHHLTPIAQSTCSHSNIIRQYYNVSSAFLRSVHISSTFSNPTDNLTKVSVIPILNLSSSGMTAWVIVAGCSISDSASPRLTATFTHSNSFNIVWLAFLSPLASKEITPPPRLICFS